MKTVLDSNPEFSLTYTHEGVSVTLSGKVLSQDYLLTAGSDQDCEELVGKIFENALPDAAHQAANELKKFHSEFHKALAIGLTPGWVEKVFDEEHLLDQPARKKGNVNLDDIGSYIDYINRHKSPSSTTIYVIADYVGGSVSFRCVINDHEAYLGTAPPQNWKYFVAVYQPRKSVEWDRWTGKNGDELTQFDFAIFIEDNLQDIAAVESMPTAQELLGMATKFLVNDADAQTVEKMKLFEKISIGIPVFWGGPAYRIDARLRYRVRESGLKFWYELIREDKVMEDATKTMIDQIKADTGVPLFFGRP